MIIASRIVQRTAAKPSFVLSVCPMATRALRARSRLLALLSDRFRRAVEERALAPDGLR
jgi:hypothetical protein